MTFHVIWATDGSPGALEAVPCLQGPLNRRDVHVSVVAVTAHQDMRHVSGVAREPVWDEADAVLAEAHRLLDGLASTSEAVLLTGEPAPVLIDYAERRRAGLILIGSRGFGPIRRLFMGSVSRAVTYRAPCSVLVLRPQPSIWRRVLVGFDESRDIGAGLDILCDGEPPPDAHATLLRVLMDRAPFPRSMQTRGRPPDAKIADRALHDITLQAQLNLEIAQRELLASGWAQVDSIVEVGRPAQQLEVRMRRDASDLIVLGARGRRGVRMHPGSVSDRLLESAPCSVLIAREGQAAGTAERFMFPT